MVMKSSLAIWQRVAVVVDRPYQPQNSYVCKDPRDFRDERQASRLHDEWNTYCILYLPARLACLLQQYKSTSHKHPTLPALHGENVVRALSHYSLRLSLKGLPRIYAVLPHQHGRKRGEGE